MNRALSLSTGDFVLFLNADDFLVDDKVIGRVAELLCNKDTDIYYGNINLRSKESEVGSFFPPRENNLIGGLSIFCLPHQAMFCSKKSFELIGNFSLRYRMLADYDWYLRAFSMGLKFKYINETISSYSLDGFSADTNTRVQEFFLIQNQSELYRDGRHDFIRFSNYLYYLNLINHTKFHVDTTLFHASENLHRNLTHLQMQILKTENLKCL
jgi:glycosyltransferase involved in cell wall biosynthesis